VEKGKKINCTTEPLPGARSRREKKKRPTKKRGGGSKTYKREKTPLGRHIRKGLRLSLMGDLLRDSTEKKKTPDTFFLFEEHLSPRKPDLSRGKKEKEVFPPSS